MKLLDMTLSDPKIQIPEVLWLLGRDEVDFDWAEVLENCVMYVAELFRNPEGDLGMLNL